MKVQAQKNKVVLWRAIRCPKCGGKDAPVQSTKLPVRYHTCKSCGYKFKSIEQ